MAATLSGLDTATPGLIPKPVATAILSKVQEQSIVTRLGQSIPMDITGTAIAVQTGHIEAGVVGEGEAKPVGSTTYGAKVVKPVKVAAIAIASNELIRKNPAGVWDNVQGDLTDAITRAFDLAVLYGRNAKTGADIAGVESLNDTTNRVVLGTTAQNAGGLSGDLLTGYDLVVNGDQVNDQFTGFAADPRFRSKVLGAVDTQGRPIFQQSVNLAAGIDNVLGLPTAYARAVSGKVGASAESKVRAFGGDWSSLRYGFAQQLTYSTTNQATVVDGATTYNLWQQNMTAILAEAIFGWVIPDVKGFVAYTDGAEA